MFDDDRAAAGVDLLRYTFNAHFCICRCFTDDAVGCDGAAVPLPPDVVRCAQVFCSSIVCWVLPERTAHPAPVPHTHLLALSLTNMRSAGVWATLAATSDMAAAGGWRSTAASAIPALVTSEGGMTAACGNLSAGKRAGVMWRNAGVSKIGDMAGDGEAVGVKNTRGRR
jgi:hypothetical protein